ncbi:glycosyltransferase [Polaribacter sp. OB-PA-B3]
MKRILISVTNDLSTDQRVAKVCKTLSENNFDVILIGRKLKNSKSLSRNYKTKRFKLLFNNGFLFYAEFNLRLFLYLLFSKKNYLLANDIDTLLPNYLISKLQNKKLVFDSHELFSEIPELVHRPKVKRLWMTLEDKIIPKLKNNYTVCDSIAKHYQNKYQTNFKTIKNLPFQKELKKGSFNFDTKNQKIILYQGATNIGRGIQLMIETVKLLDNYIFVIIGDGDEFLNLKLKIASEKLEKKVFLLGRKTPAELAELTPLADLGISVEEDLGLNYKYALPNKIFDYIQANVPVLVSDLPEMKAIVSKYNVGEVLKNRKPAIIAKQIQQMLENDYLVSIKTAKKELIWENQETDLIQIFENLE